MKILYHHRTLADGAEGIHIYEIINAFRKTGHEVVLIGATPQMNSNDTHSPIRNGLTTIQWLRWHLPDIVYETAQVVLGALNYFKVAKAILREKPDFIYKRHSNYDFGPILAAKHFKVPLFLEANSSYVSEEIIKFEKIHYPYLTRLMERIIFKNSTLIFVISSSLKKKVERLKIDPQKIIVTPNGANLDMFYPRMKDQELLREYQLQNKFIIGFVGIPRAWHGLNFLMQAFEMIRNAIPQSCLLFVGSNAPTEFQGREGMVFTGRIPHDKIADYIALFDLAVLPAEYRMHASPMKIPEYMAMGKVVLAPDLENIRDLIKNEHDGILFKQDDVSDFVEKVINLYNHPQKRKVIAKNAVETTKARLNWDAICKIIIEHYAQISQNKGSFYE